MILLLFWLLDAGESSVPPSLSVPALPFGALEHVNLNAGLSWRDDAFWFEMLRCSSDPRASSILEATNQGRTEKGDPLMGGLTWVNVGLQQFHLPTGDELETTAEQTLRGEIVLSWPADKFEGLQQRLRNNGYYMTDDGRVVGPSKNRFVFEVGEKAYGPVEDAGQDVRDMLPGGPSEGLGIRAVRFDVRPHTAERICTFYETIFAANSTAILWRDSVNRTCVVDVGFGQALEFRETTMPLDDYNGEHIALYIADGDIFKESYFRAKDHDLVFHSRRSPHIVYATYDDVMRVDEFRFKRIIDLRTNETLHELEHEIRSLSHKGFLLDHRLPPSPSYLSN